MAPVYLSTASANSTRTRVIPQCSHNAPLPSGQTMTYRWRVTQYGIMWYHFHIGLQTWEDVFGGVIINGPASVNYDVDIGTILLNDWDVRMMDEVWDAAQSSNPPTVDNALINGTNVFGDDGKGQAGRIWSKVCGADG